MAKVEYDFAPEVRLPVATQAEIEAAVASYNQEQSINIQPNGVFTKVKKELVCGFLTFPANLDQAHLDWIAALLGSTHGVDGATPPIPQPPSLFNLDAVAGIAAAGAIFPDSAQAGYVRVEWTNPATGIGKDGGTLDADGYTDGLANPDPQVYDQIALEFELLAGASGKMEFAADSIVLKDTAGTEFALNHPKLTFNVPAQSKHRINMYILGDELYLFFAVEAGSVTLPRKGPEDAVALPINPLSADYAVS